MSSSRSQGRASSRLRLSAAVFCAAAAFTAAAFAQVPAATSPATDAPAQQSAPSTPAPQNGVPPSSVPAPVPASSLPSIAAPVPTPPPASQSTAPGTYRDPLQQPIIVGAPPVQPPAEPPVQTPTQTPAPVPVTMPSPALNANLPSVPAYDPQYGTQRSGDNLGSTYIPVDSPIYTMGLRLYSLGYLDTAFIALRPWTRRSLLHMLDASSPAIIADNNQQALEILAKLKESLADENPADGSVRGLVYGPETFYTRVMGISGQTLHDSYHLGQTIINDYGRPYEPGFNNITGFSSVNEWGRFSLYLRGEYQHSPSATGYSTALASQLSLIDQIPYPGTNNYNLNQSTIPGPFINAQNPFALQEAVLSFHFLGHEISGGKSDAWVGPGYGGAMAWSNNAQNIYSFRINRVEPLQIPLLSRLTGPFRYDFFVGSLKGHSYPNSPWMHSEQVSFRPTSNVELGFERAVIWGGHGHGCLAADGSIFPCDEPVNFQTFLKSFFSFNDTQGTNDKYSVNDPGARFTAFNFSWRLPYMHKYVTLYTDSEAHDDVTPPSAPRRAAYRPGIFLSQVPGLPRLDVRVEAASTDTSTLRSEGGQFNYYETIQRQGYTNKGFIIGDWIGREAKGGQAWLTYHLSGNEWVQVEYLSKKGPKDFIPGGTTQDQFKAEVLKRLRPDIELDAWLQFERWKAPIYITNPNNAANHDTTVAFQVTFFPKLRTQAHLNGK